MNSFATAGFLALIAILCQLLAIGFFIGFIVRLILFIAGKSKISEAKRTLDDMQNKMRKVKRRETATKDDIADAQDDIDVAYQRYKQAVSARAKHQFHFIVCIAVSIVAGLSTLVLGLAAVGSVTTAVQQRYEDSSNQYQNSYDTWSVNQYLQDLNNSLGY